MADKNTLELQIKVLADQALSTVKSMSAEIKNLAQSAKTSGTTDFTNALQNVQAQAKRTADSIKLFGVNTVELKNVQTQLKNTVLDLTQKGFSAESEEVQKLVKQYKDLDKAAGDIDSANASNTQSFGSLKDAITTSATALAAIKAVSIASDLTGYALQQADSFDTARKELGILLGDVQAGNTLFEQLQDFNIKTPFDLETTQQATNVLLAAKVPVQELQDKLTEFGDLSQGNTQKFTSFINAFSKGSAKGKADMEVLNVYLDQGIPILDELAKNANTTSAQIVKMASEGKISFTDFQTALESLTSEGGRYYGTMAIGAESLSGVQEGLKESVNALSASIGQALLPIVKESLLVFTSIVNAINESPILKGVLAGAVVALTGYFVAMAVKTAILTAKTWLQQAAQMGLNASIAVTNPLMIAGIAAATAATIAAVAYATSQNDAALATDAQAGSLDNLAKSAETATDWIKTLNKEQLKDNIKSYETVTLPNLEASVKQAENKLATAPQPFRKSQMSRGRIKYVEVIPEEYKQAEAELAKVNGQLADAQNLYQNILAQHAQLSDAEFAKNLEDGNLLLQRRNELYAKTPEGQREQLVSLLEEAKAYYDHVSQDADGGWTGFDKSKTDAIVRDAQKALDDFDAKNANPEFIQSWTDKGLDAISALKLDAEKAQTTLDEKALASFGNSYKTEKSYIEEIAALQEYYANKIAETQKSAILSQHQEKIGLLKEEYEYQKELARQQMDTASSAGEYASTTGEYALSSVQSATADTDLGQVLMGADPVTMLIDSLLSAVLAIESVTESLNFIGTTVNALVSFIEPLINEIFKPIADIFKELGEVVGQILSPQLGALAVLLRPVIGAIRILLSPAQALAVAFEWFYNSVIKPVGNGIVGVMNAVIGALNKIPFVNIKKLDYLPLIGEKAEEAAKAMDRATETVTKLYEKQIDDVQDQLSAQIDSLKTQYELGLITGDQYDEGVEKYTAVADDKIISLNEEMNKHLEAISAWTQISANKDDAEATSEAAKSYSEKWGDSWSEKAGWLGKAAGTLVGGVVDTAVDVANGVKKAASAVGDWVEKVPVLGPIVGGIADTVGGIVNGAKNVASKVGDFFSGLKFWDVGTTNISADHHAVVHKGEAIIPRTFADGIRSGEMALVGNENFGASKSGSAGTVISLTVNVGGNVTSEKELSETIYDNIANLIQSGKKQPLPIGA